MARYLVLSKYISYLAIAYIETNGGGMIRNMSNGIFLSKSNVFSGDCGCDLHSPTHEPAKQMHYHDFYEVIVYLGSHAAFVLEDREFPVRRGDIVLVRMFANHMFIPHEADQEEYFVVAHANPELLITYSTSNANLLDIFQSAASPVHSLQEHAFQKYRRLMGEYRAVRQQSGQDLLIKAIVHQLLAYAYTDCFTGAHSSESVSRDLTVVTRIINYINTHLTEQFSLQMLASEINYSESYICHLFKAATGKTISHYSQEKRIELAAGLLERPIPITQVAEQAGFRNYSHFYKTFLRQMASSPAAYRERLRVHV